MALDDHPGGPMARITVVRASPTYRVAIRGRISARDLARLEHACGPALEEKDIPVELRLDSATSIDDAAAAYVERLCARGARLDASGAALVRARTGRDVPNSNRR
jgi:hypothetical protein